MPLRESYLGPSNTQGGIRSWRLDIISTRSLLHRLTCASGLLIISALVVGCAGYTQQPKVVGGLSFSATSFDFQTVAVGQTATKTLNISNTSSAPVQISALSVSNKSFSVSGPSVPRTILPRTVPPTLWPMHLLLWTTFPHP